MPKQILDKGIALLLLVLLAPVFALVLAVMGIDMLVSARDRGRWLYRERRVSRGREFDLLKFRTLRRDVLERVRSEEAHARLHEGDEANLTWVARRVLKPWYLDELPQIWNVLRGDMSIVGPRPWPPSMVANQIANGLTYRNEFVAGWTGPVQVAKGITRPADYSQLDLAYVRACRQDGAAKLVRRDLGLLWSTVRVLGRGEGLRF
jgi:lipopolysaccharide/colanic/teichoic acid biosynthesis glycosyltransferase